LCRLRLRLFLLGAGHRPGERIQYLFKLKNLLEEHIDELSKLITLENGKTFAEAKAEWRRGIENVEVACGIPVMMQGYNLEDITPGVDETLIRQPLGVVAAICALQFSGDDSVLVSALRDCVRQHLCVEAKRARAADRAAHDGAHRKDRHSQERREHRKRRQGCCGRVVRSSGGACDQLCGFHAGGQACVPAVCSGGEADAMPGRARRIT